MTKQSWTLAALGVVLGGLYISQFTDLGRARQIQINVSSRPFAPRLAPGDPLPIIFGMDQEWKLTALRVLPLAAVSNANPKTVWNLASKLGSQPLRGFAYGDVIPGMLASAPSSPEKLVPGIRYRLYVEAGTARGVVDFTPQASEELTTQ